MRIAFALAVFFLIVIPRVQAAPLNNQVPEAKPSVKTEVVQQTITSEAPTPASQPVPVQEQPQQEETQVVETPPTQAISCGDNIYANYIYTHESNCSTVAVNSIGCRGIGQSCPGDKLPCGDDYACQNEWFTNYALTRYGSWENAYYWWLDHQWW